MMKNKYLPFLFLSILLLGATASHAKHYRFISIDSGGTLGAIPAELLIHIKKTTGLSTIQWADGASGISTGGIIVSLLGAGTSEENVLGFYKTHGPAIFGPAIMAAISGDTKAPTEAFAKAASSVFGTKSISSSLFPIQILSCDEGDRTCHAFNSHQAKMGVASDVHFADVVRATSAVKGIFGSVKLTLPECITRDPHLNGRCYVDPGSFGVNDGTPYAVRFAEAQLGTGDTATVYSFGTGFAPASTETVALIAKNGTGRITVVRIEATAEQIKALSIKTGSAGMATFAMMGAAMTGRPAPTGLENNILGAQTTAVMFEGVNQIAQEIIAKDAGFRSLLTDISSAPSTSTSSSSSSSGSSAKKEEKKEEKKTS